MNGWGGVEMVEPARRPAGPHTRIAMLARPRGAAAGGAVTEADDHETTRSGDLAAASVALQRFVELWATFARHARTDDDALEDSARAALLAKDDADDLMTKVFLDAIDLDTGWLLDGAIDAPTDR